MISIQYNHIKDRVEISFSGENFSEFLNLMKSKHLIYKDNGIWTGKPKKIFNILDEISQIENYRISESTYRYLCSHKAIIETEFIRRQYKSELLKHPPIKGKYPNENYQIEDTIKGIRQNRLYLAHEQGLGKTIILINIINHFWYYKLIDKILIIVPSEGLCNWKREILKFSNFFIEEDITIANRFNREPFKNKYNIVIMTYGTFRMISDDYHKYIFPSRRSVKKYKTPVIPFDRWGINRMVILDEAHNLKDPKTRQTHLINLHKKYFKFRYFASGTPDPNGVEGIYSQIKFLDEGIIQEDYYDWIPKIANLGNRYSDYAINSYKPEAIEEFMNLIKPWVIRRLSKDHLELPDLIIDKIYVEFTDKHKKIYRLFIKKIMKEIEDLKLNFLDEGKNFNEINRVISKFAFLSLAIDNPDLLRKHVNIEDGELFNLINSWNLKDHSKTEVCDSLIHKYIKEQDRKVIIWSTHPLTINQLVEHYKKYKPYFIHGQMQKISKFKNMDRAEIKDCVIENFKKSKNRNLLIASSLAVCTAINIIQCNRVIYFDRNQDLKIWLQSIKRTHRIGQKEHVIVNPLICEKSLDVRTDKILTKREDINKYLFKRDALTNEEWRAIFEGEDIDV